MVYKCYINKYCQLGDSMVPIPPLKGNQETTIEMCGFFPAKNHKTWGGHFVEIISERLGFIHHYIIGLGGNFPE